jgi:hypothetical protein
MYIKWFGSILGWWSMVYEREQGKLKKNCRTSKNYIKHIVMEQVKKEYIHSYNRKMSKDIIPSDSRAFLYGFSKSTVVIIGKSFSMENLNIKQSIYSKFVHDITGKYPNSHAAMLSFSSFERSQFRCYKKIRCGNCIFSTKFNCRSRLKNDSFMEIKNSGTPVASRYFQRGDILPSFGICTGIYAISPFFDGPFKNNVVYFFHCMDLKTLGYHRTLWYVDMKQETLDDSTSSYYSPKDIIEVQVLVGQHGDLDPGHQSIMRIGRDVILYAPLEA